MIVFMMIEVIVAVKMEMLEEGILAVVAEVIWW